MTVFFTYRTYPVDDQDPVIEELRRVMKEKGVDILDLVNLSGVSPMTLHDWFSGKTKGPKYKTVAACFTSLGHAKFLPEVRKINLGKELDEASEWRKSHHGMHSHKSTGGGKRKYQ